MTVLDLDAEPQPRPSMSPAILVALVVALGGLLLGAGVAAMSGQQAPPAAEPAIVARVELAGLEMAPRPRARLFVTVRNDSSRVVRVGPLRPQGGGILQAPLALRAHTDVPGADARLVPPGAVRLLEASADLVCTPVGPVLEDPIPANAPPLAADLDVTSGEQALRAVTVVSGGIGRGGGACAQARSLLPRGWDDTAAVLSADVVGRDLRITLPPLPSGPRRVIGVRADGWFLRADRLGQDVTAGPTVLQVSRPAPACADIGKRTRLSSGVELMLLEPTGNLTIAYVQVGPTLSAWLAETYTQTCPPDSLVPAGMTPSA